MTEAGKIGIKSASMIPPDPIRVVILGGGFGGIATAKELARLMRGDPVVEVHLVNNENYFVFQPLIPEVVSCSIEPSHIVNPIRQLCPGVQFHCATVKEIDLEGRRVVFGRPEEKAFLTLVYDHLVWCLGMATDLSRVPGMREHGLPLKSLGDAFYLRNHILNRLEEADLEEDETRRKAGLVFVVIGGGFSGVETAAEINDMLAAAMKFYPRARGTGYHVSLIHAAERVLPELDETLSSFAHDILLEHGVQVITNTAVQEITAGGVLLSSGESLAADTVICTVGNAPHPLLETARLPHVRGRIEVDAAMRVEGYPNVWALGDGARIPDLQRGQYCPPTAQYAMREGTQCARNILAAIRGDRVRPFRFGGLGQLAAVGRHCAVGQVLGRQIRGLFAWYLWRGVYLSKVPGLRCKLRIGIDWVLDAVFPRDIAKFDVGRTQSLRRAHFRDGDVIIRQGDIAEEFYILEAGEVEVMEEQPGQPPQRISQLGPGASFGEISLLNGTRRTSTVRCLSAVDVVVLTRRDFHGLLSNEALRGLMEKQARTILERDALRRSSGSS
jgi:NADH:ubiquinone reductase (H+-translocating)